MYKYFIDHPVVSMVIAIFTVIIGALAAVTLPIAQFPDIAPPEILVKASYTGADALTVEQSVATPIEQQMSGVDNMAYMYSVNSSNGSLQLTVTFDVGSSPNTDQILSQMRQSQSASQLPLDVNTTGVTVQKSTSAPMMLVNLYSEDGRYDAGFLANYAVINLNDQLTRVPGVGSVTVFGAGQYAMRVWVKPDQLAKLGITVPEILSAIQAQNTVNPAGQLGGQPIPAGQELTYTVRTEGRLTSEAEFGEIALRVDPDGSVLRLKDVARVELGSQTYNVVGRLDGKPSAVISIYQLPGSNALQTAAGVRKLFEEARLRFPPGLLYTVALDATTPVTEGMHEIVQTLLEALALVAIVVYLFLQSWRATLIPLMAVPVALIGVFMLFPLLGFSINTLSLFGLVLAIGLVVDDAIVVVEAVEQHIERGLSPRDASLQAMREVAAPVIGIAVVLAAVFIPTAFIPGITGRLYQQFAITIAVSVILSAFNALTLSPTLAALLLRPRQKSRGALGRFFAWFNRMFDRGAGAYARGCGILIHKTAATVLILVSLAGAGLWAGRKVPSG
ncbi:MAG: efflux RND transporter permease subunit, partial [Acidobacteriaceae bacterium]|nr:efflux RND transporter permease subunit [Acidobacteriaceae bacterium]